MEITFSDTVSGVDSASLTGRKVPIVVFASTDWTGRRVSRQHLISRLAQRGWPVVYSTGALHTWERFRPRWAAAPWFGTFDSIEGVLVDRPGRWRPRCERFPVWDRAAIKAHTNRLLKLLGNPARDELICYVFDPMFLPYARELQAKYLVFHVYDAFELTPDYSDELGAREVQLAQEADLFLTVSKGMTSSLPEDLREKALELPHGVDTARFAAEGQECPADLAAIPRPRLGYTGTINAKLDLELMTAIAKQRPQWNWVLIGKSFLDAPAGAPPGVTARQWRILRDLPNVHYLGEKSYRDMPSYLHHMDVNTICYATDRPGWWIRGYPLKLHELLAVGKPIVGALLETIVPFSHVVEIAKGPQQWMEALERALYSGGRGTIAERRAEAVKNTWDQRLDVLEARLLKMRGAAT